MRKLSESISGVTSGIGMTQGVMNHYTPIDNIIINTRNIFGALLGLVVSKGEDGISLKIQSSSFTNPEVTRNILYNSTFDVTQILFKSEATNIVMNNEDIYFIKDNKLYLYDGYIKEVLKYDELSFNSTNRYAVYKKS